MRKDLQKRLLAVAAVLDRTTAQQKLADGEDKNNFWKKFFHKEPKVEPQIAPEAPKAKEEKPAPQKMPQPQQDPQLPANAVVDFLQGGPIPLEIVNPLLQMSKALAGAGAIAEKDAKNIVAFLARSLRKYLGGQKLAAVSAATKKRKDRIAATLVKAEDDFDVKKWLGNPSDKNRSSNIKRLRWLLVTNGGDWNKFVEKHKHHLSPEEISEHQMPKKEASFTDQLKALGDSKVGFLYYTVPGFFDLKDHLSNTPEKDRPAKIKELELTFKKHNMDWGKFTEENKETLAPYTKKASFTDQLKALGDSKK